MLRKAYCLTNDPEVRASILKEAQKHRLFVHYQRRCYHDRIWCAIENRYRVLLFTVFVLDTLCTDNYKFKVGNFLYYRLVLQFDYRRTFLFGVRFSLLL